jgi:hypothetical protein
VKREEQDRIFYLLASRSSDFEETRREILMRLELPSLNTVCSIIQSEETQKRVMGRSSKVNPSNSDNYAHYSNSVKFGDENRSIKGKDKKRGKYQCNHCNRNGHTVDRCWVLYPHLKPAKLKSSSALLTTHSGSDPIQQRLDQLTRQVEMLIKNNSNASASGVDNTETTNLIKQHGKHFVLTTGSNSHIIVDSGATDNMFSSGKLLSKPNP